jgi:hypothetical protein
VSAQAPSKSVERERALRPYPQELDDAVLQAGIGRAIDQGLLGHVRNMGTGDLGRSGASG